MKVIVLIAILAVSCCSAIEQRLSFTQSLPNLAVSTTFTEGSRNQLGFFDSGKAGLIKLYACFGVSSILIRIKFDTKAVLTTSPLVPGDVFAFAIPPNSQGKNLILEFQSTANSGICLLEIE